MDRVVISTGDFNLQQLAYMPMLPNFKASPESIAALAAKAGDLLSQASNANPTPTAIVPMPADKRVVVAQLADVALRMYEPTLYGYRLQAERSTIRGSEMLAESHFTFDSVTKRLDYHTLNEDK